MLLINVRSYYSRMLNIHLKVGVREEIIGCWLLGAKYRILDDSDSVNSIKSRRDREETVFDVVLLYKYVWLYLRR